MIEAKQTQDIIRFQLDGKEFPYISFNIPETKFNEQLLVEIEYFKKDSKGNKYLKNGEPARGKEVFIICRLLDFEKYFEIIKFKGEIK